MSECSTDISSTFDRDDTDTESLDAQDTISSIFTDEERRSRGDGTSPAPPKLPKHYRTNLYNVVDKYPVGWSTFAATQVALYNGGTYRRFAVPIARVLLHMQSRIDNLQQQLEEHERNPSPN